MNLIFLLSEGFRDVLVESNCRLRGFFSGVKNAHAAMSRRVEESAMGRVRKEIEQVL